MADSYEVRRSVTVDAPAERTHELVRDFHLWPQWSPWEDLDADLERTYGGAPDGAGATYAWSGNRKAGRGHMEILEETPGSVTVEVTFEKPFRSRSTSVFTFEESAGRTEVVWTMTGPRTTALRVMGLVTSMDKLMGPDFEKGLARLAAVAESEAR